MAALDKLEVGGQEISLQAKRRELISNIVEGRAVIATLVDRHAAMGRKIEDATTGLRRLEEQLTALNTVIELFDQAEQVPTQEAIVARPPLRAVEVAPQASPAVAAPAPAPVSRPESREGFKPLAYMRCMTEGHTFMNSRSTPGHVTCTHCRHRRRM